MTDFRPAAIDRPPVWWDRLGVRAALLFAASVGLAYGNPIPFAWTQLPALIRTSERLLTRGELALDPRALYAPPEPISPLYLGLLAVLGAAVWRALDRRRTPEVALREVVCLVTRYVLAAELLRHGMAKVLATEVVPPDAVDWVRPWGEFETCELLRVWLGYPPMYVLFMGLGEAAAGVMLLLRRTTSLGAVIAAATMTNLVMLGTSYCSATAGVYAAAYAALAGFLILADRDRLLRFLLLGRPTIPRPLKPRWPTSAWTRRAGMALQALVVSWLVYADGYSAIRLWVDYGYMSSLRGVYRVESFARDGSLEPLAYESPRRWLVVAIGNFSDRVAIRTVDGTQVDFVVAPLLPADEASWRRERAAQTAGPHGTLTLIGTGSARTPSPLKDTMTYFRSAPDELVLEGRVGGEAVTARLRRIQDETFSFYHWLWRR
jgi:uncharacterized membrane protein YphA (DoxX/SURF4 family)